MSREVTDELPPFLTTSQAATVWAEVTRCCPLLLRSAGDQVWRQMCASGELEAVGVTVIRAGGRYLIPRDQLLAHLEYMGDQIARTAAALREACDTKCDTFPDNPERASVADEAGSRRR